MESISRISSLLETGMAHPFGMFVLSKANLPVLPARDLTLEAARDASSSARKTSSRILPAAQLKKLLDSRHERDVLEGLRRVISMTYRHLPTLPYFPLVIKNIASPSLEVKKLVYIYLIHHAEAEPDTALLSINSIQKSLSDPSPQLRALALRVMSSIRVPVISQIVALGIKRGAADMSPLVRRAAALAIPKCYRLDPATLPQLLEYLAGLLGDRQYYVAGAAVAAFLRVCPDRIDLIHQHYRGLVRKLVDMDEWSQLATLRLMTVYARRCFPRRTRRVRRGQGGGGGGGAQKGQQSTKDFYGEESGTEEGAEENDGHDSDFTEEVILDPDLDLLLRSAQSLLQSRNSAVVVAVARCYLHLGTPTYLDTAIGPLVALLRSAQDIQYIALHDIVQVCLARPGPFVAYTSHFLLRATDPPHIRRLKLELLTLIFPHAPPHLRGLVLSELAHFARGHDAALVREAVRAIGRCAQSSDAATSARCLRLLLHHLASGDADPRLVAESLEVVRHLIQRQPGAHGGTVVRLARNLDTLTAPQARASIIWLVGEFAGLAPRENVAADVLRILVRGFAEESAEAKLQIVLLAAKVYVQHLNLLRAERGVEEGPTSAQLREAQPVSTVLTGPEEEGGFTESAFDPPASTSQTHLPNMLQGQEKERDHPIALLWRYVLLLARYDTSYDLRDRARLYRALLAVPYSTELASLLLLAPKPVPQTPSPSESRKGYTLGSASLVVGEGGGVGGLKGYEPLPEWVHEGDEPDPRLRDEGGVKMGYVERREVPAGERLDSAVAAERAAVGMQKVNGVKEKTLDDWLAEGEESESESESEEEESGEDESEETEEESSGEEGTEEESDEDEGERDRLVK